MNSKTMVREEQGEWALVSEEQGEWGPTRQPTS
jgi:hypothetical protein